MIPRAWNGIDKKWCGHIWRPYGDGGSRVADQEAATQAPPIISGPRSRGLCAGKLRWAERVRLFPVHYNLPHDGRSQCLECGCGVLSKVLTIPRVERCVETLEPSHVPFQRVVHPPHLRFAPLICVRTRRDGIRRDFPISDPDSSDDPYSCVLSDDSCPQRRSLSTATARGARSSRRSLLCRSPGLLFYRFAFTMLRRIANVSRPCLLDNLALRKITHRNHRGLTNPCRREQDHYCFRGLSHLRGMPGHLFCAPQVAASAHETASLWPRHPHAPRPPPPQRWSYQLY